MKATKYIVIVIAIISLLATAAWFVRNTLIEQLSAPILKDYDVEIVDVSLDTLATGQARIGRLELLHAKGTTIVIEGLSLPIATPGTGSKLYTAEKISIVTTTRAEEAPFELARLIDQFLALTDNLPFSDISVGEFSFAPYPVIRDLHWAISATEQNLSGAVDSIRIALATEALNATTYKVALSLPELNGIVGSEVQGELQQTSAGISLSGDGNVELQAWEALTKLAGIVPDAVALYSGIAELQFIVEVPYDVSQTPSMSATLFPASQWRLGYINESGSAVDLRVSSDEPIKITAAFPAVDWSIQWPSLSLLASYGEWSEIPVSLFDIECRTGPRCSMKTDISWAEARLVFGSAEKLSLSAVLDVSFPGSDVRIDAAPEANVSIAGLSAAATSAALVEATLVSGASFEMLASGWRFSADSVDIDVQSMSAGDGIFMSVPIFAENVDFSNLEQKPQASMGLYAPEINAAINQQTVALPGLRGTLSMSGSEFRSNLDTVGLQQNGKLTVYQDMSSGNGSLSIENTAVSFASKKMSKRVTPWNYDWDLIAGVISVDGQVRWDLSGEDIAVETQVSLRAADAAGFYGDNVITGLFTDLHAGYTTANGFTAEPTSIRIALIDIGLPLENITADYEADLNSLSADVKNLRMTAFGGSIWADPFSFHTDSDSNNVTLHAESIQLEEILSLKEFEAISVTGSIGATLPVNIEKEKVTIVGGTLLGDAPGGVIRYRVANTPDPTSTSSMDLVTRALSNFVYKSLTSEVDYNPAGDLVLRMRLEGRNPDMEGSRPVILNLSVENNVPQMLRSLQAARAVEEVLEKRVRK